MYSHVYATGHIKDPVPLIEKRRGLSPGGRFPPSFIHQVGLIKGFGMSSLVYATGHIKDPVPLVEKSRGLSPGGRFPPSFIH